MRSAPPNNPLKLPLFALCAVIGLALIVVGALGARDGAWGLVIVGVIFLAPSTVAIRSIRHGRNPMWIRAPLDYWPRRTDRR
jgi:hypothetical protein